MEGERIRLRDFRETDLPVYEQWLAPDQEWRRWDGPYYTTDASHTERQLEAARERITNGDCPEPRQRLVIAARESDALIGVVSRYWISEETHWLALGIGIYDPAWWGKGIGFEALSLWCDHLFRALPEIVRLDLRTWSGNERMIRLAKKLGFTEEARFRDARVVEGKRYDGLGFGILRTEWGQR